MRSKLFEVRDSGTLIVVMATRTNSLQSRETDLLEYAGWGGNSIILANIDGGAECGHDPFYWRAGAITRFLRRIYICKSTLRSWTTAALLMSSTLAAGQAYRK